MLFEILIPALEPSQIKDQIQYIAEDAVRMLISSDPEAHRKEIQKFIDLGFDQVYLHNVGRNQTEWIDVFGREVLPKLTM